MHKKCILSFILCTSVINSAATHPPITEVAKSDDLAQVRAFGSDLYRACFQGNTELARTLITSRSDIKVPWESYRREPFMHAVCAKGDVETAELLLDRGVLPNIGGTLGEPPLFAACQSGNGLLVELLIFRGANVNAVDRGATPLTVSCALGNIEIVRRLLTVGGDVGFRKGYGTTALHAASGAGHLPIVKFLCDRGAEVNIKGRENITPLMLACGAGRVDVVEFLLGQGADTRGYAYYGRKLRATPLACAAMNGLTETVGMLFAYGARPDGIALKCAFKKGNLSIVQMFMRRMPRLPKDYEIKSSYPEHIKEYLSSLLHPEPVVPDDLLHPKAAASSFRLIRKFKSE